MSKNADFSFARIFSNFQDWEAFIARSFFGNLLLRSLSDLFTKWKKFFSFSAGNDAFLSDLRKVLAGNSPNCLKISRLSTAKRWVSWHLRSGSVKKLTFLSTATNAPPTIQTISQQTKLLKKVGQKCFHFPEKLRQLYRRIVTFFKSIVFVFRGLLLVWIEYSILVSLLGRLLFFRSNAADEKKKCSSFSEQFQRCEKEDFKISFQRETRTTEAQKLVMASFRLTMPRIWLRKKTFLSCRRWSSWILVLASFAINNQPTKQKRRPLLTSRVGRLHSKKWACPKNHWLSNLILHLPLLLLATNRGLLRERKKN